MKVSSRVIGSAYHPYVIAELSANHGGSIERAKETIRAAHIAGASAIKIQTYTPDTMTINSSKEDFKIKKWALGGKSLYDLYQEAFTPFEWHQDLFKFANEIGITIFSSPFDETAAALLEKLNAPAYKIASFEMTDHRLIECVAKTGKPLFISTGMASIDEISETLEVAKRFSNNEILLFHCVSSYPAPMSEMNLLAIKTLSEKFNVLLGLSDHSIGSAAAVASVALGAVAIEKHFILDRGLKGPDSSFSVESKELKTLVDDVNNTWKALGNGIIERGDMRENLVFRRSLYFVKKLKKGDIIDSCCIRRIRPGYGLSPKYENLIIGQPVKMDVEICDRVTEEHVSNLVID